MQNEDSQTDDSASDRVLDELDLHLFAEGTHRYLHRSFGAQPGDGGTRFAVWAPNAAERRGRPDRSTTGRTTI